MIMRFKTLGMSAAGILAVGSFAVATGVHSVAAACSGTPGGVAGVYAGSSQIGATGATAVGVCTDLGSTVTTPAGTIEGGWVEVGASTSHGVVYNPVGGQPVGGLPGVYAVAQGNNTSNNGGSGPGNTFGTGAGEGYIGVSNYETGTAAARTNDSPCDPTPSNTGGDSNSGGTLALFVLCNLGVEGNNGEIFVNGTPTGVFLVSPIVCGHLSGNDWGTTNRDGCEEN
jgi:hypothetical protein